MCIAPPFIIAKIWSQSKWQSTDEGIKRMWCTLLFSHEKDGNPVIPRKMEGPEDIMLSEGSQIQKDKCQTLFLRCGS